MAWNAGEDSSMAVGDQHWMGVPGAIHNINDSEFHGQLKLLWWNRFREYDMNCVGGCWLRVVSAGCQNSRTQAQREHATPGENREVSVSPEEHSYTPRQSWGSHSLPFFGLARISVLKDLPDGKIRLTHGTHANVWVSLTVKVTCFK